MVSLVADFNYKYYFSSNISTPWMTDFLNRHIPDFLKNSTPIVTSQFIAEELSKFYPEYAYKTQIIPLAPLSRSVDENLVKKTLNKFGIRKKFLLYPTNTANHKNIGSLLASLVHICKAGHDVCLVLAGLGTQNINGKACQEGIELNASEQNVFGLGYVTHEEIDALIQSAAVVVNCSLYEGNNGPALDAWTQGVPVAMSRIPVFVELLNTFNVHAALFDPRSPVDIAEKINQLLTDRETTRKNAMDSKISIAEFTWERFARTYVEIFKNSSQCSCAQ